MQLSKCPTSDISPCPLLDPEDDPWLKHPVNWPHILDGAELDHPESIADAAGNASAHAVRHALPLMGLQPP